MITLLPSFRRSRRKWCIPICSEGDCVTLIVGLNLGDYALLGADTRVTCRHQNGDQYFEDDADKIYRFSLGVIAGAGLQSLVESAKDLVDGAAIAHIDHLAEIIEQERTRVLDGIAESDVREGIAHTQWMFTYLAAQNANRPQLATTGGGANQHWTAVPLNRAWLLSPAGTTPEQLQEWADFLQENMRPVQEGEDLNANMAHHREVIGRLMRMVSQVNEGVSATFRVGIHAVPNRVGISNLYRHDGIRLVEC
jgi:hypothetical protein